MRNDRYWRYGCFVIAAAMVLYSVRLARLDALLRHYCKKAMFESFFGQYGLYLLFLLMAAFLLLAVLQWVVPRVRPKRLLLVTAAAVCVYAVLAYGYLDYHHEVYVHAAKAQQKQYDRMYDKGLLYDVKSLFR